MQSTSETYNALISSPNHWFETRLFIGASNSSPSPVNAFDENHLLSVEIVRRVFSNGKPEIGCCVAGEINVEMIYNENITIPRMAKIVPYTRVTDGELASEWLQKGVFYVDTRERTANTDDLSILTIHGYDDMLKAGKPFDVSEGSWPRTDVTVVQNIASAMGVSVLPATLARINRGYSIPNPKNYTYREALGFIASMYAGNFIMDDLGRLKLIYLNES